MAQQNRLIQDARYERRRRKLLKQIKGEIAIFPAAPEQPKSRDQLFPYQPNTDLLYLTGFEEAHSVLVLLGSTKGPRSILYLRDRDALHERWNGERLGLKRARRRFAVDEVHPIEAFESQLMKLLEPFQTLHYPAGVNPRIDQIIWRAFCSQTAPRVQGPHTIRDARLLTSLMRIRKDREEIRALRHICEITANAFVHIAPLLKSAKSELHAARMLEAEFFKLGAHGVAFNTIVASGKNATVLHHEPSLQPLWKRELVLIDAGASFQGYAADISRTIPPSGKFTDAQAKVYDVVLAALEASLERCQPGSDLEAIHTACVRALIRGLQELDIIKSPAPKAYNDAEYRRYYMHRTGHWLGLDVHDVAPIYCGEYLVPPSSRPLEPGNVFTVEPGLYFDSNDETVPPEFRGIGIRIEEDVVITATGAEVLTSGVPRARLEVEQLIR
ncbi:MAG: aminopeptidase P N-terminal domain-containing protein [Bdellovibrionales bacterium]|nr:aminopeptidase P N-terminal domain-containing protein [Bdellovibrionales bacterium]